MGSSNLRARAARWTGFVIVAALAVAAPGLAAGAAGAAQAQPGTAALTAARSASGMAAAGQAIVSGPTTTYTRPPGGSAACTTYTYAVPAGVDYLQAVVIGQGGSGGGRSLFKGGGGGKGEEVDAEVPVTPGEPLYVNVAFNGSGGSGSGGHVTSGGAGGEASFITTDSGALTGGSGRCQAKSFAVVAGGGGGGGGGATYYKGGNGGDAGFSESSPGDPTSKVSGQPGGSAFGKSGGSGGKAVAGSSGNGGSGSFLLGGCGGACGSDALNINGGGGGGGGYYGGGGGGAGAFFGAGGGGGGDSYVETAATHISDATTSAAPSVSLTPVIDVPGAPTGVRAVVGNQRATVSFTPPAIDGGSPVEYYTVTAHPGGVRLTTTATSLTFPDLTAGTSYTFTVTATNVVGQSAPSAPSAPVVPYRLPGAPVIQSVTTGEGQVTVAFTPSQADQRLGNPVTSYTVIARQGVNVTTGSGITATKSASPITVIGLTNGTNYTVTVYATNAAGNGPESLPKVVTPQGRPSAPTNVVAANATPVGAATGSVTVSFSPPADNGGGTLTGYTVTSSPGGITATTNSGNTSVTVTGLTIGTSYTFTVHATSTLGNGPESAPSNAVTPTAVGTPSPPLNPGVAALNQEAYVSCLPPLDDGGSAITSYTVTAEPGDITATGTSCPILVQGLTNGVSYTFTVTATNADGGTSQPSQQAGPVTPHVASGGTPPANDDFANAQVLTGASGSVTGTNVGATVEPGEPTIQDNAGGASVWYAWTAPANGTVTFDTCSATPGVDGHIEAFLGSSVGSLTPFGPGPGQDLCPAGEAGSTISFIVSAGVTIDVKFDGISYGNGPSEGPFALEWSLQ